MIEAINRATLRGKLANSNIEFKSYEDYERLQELIDSCAELHAVPIGYIELWIDQHRDTSGSAGYYLRWMLSDYLHWGKGTVHEDDFKKTAK